jgi:hypothetical protein
MFLLLVDSWRMNDVFIGVFDVVRFERRLDARLRLTGETVASIFFPASVAILVSLVLVGNNTGISTALGNHFLNHFNSV